MVINTYGYHGTTQSAAEKIVSEQRFIDSKKDNEWLGSGVYFFPYKAQAKWWISHSRYLGVKTCILGAELSYTPDQLLDLDDPEQLDAANRIVKEFVKIMNSKGSAKPSVDLTNEISPEKWNFSCNAIRALSPGIGIISYTFPTNCMPGASGFRTTGRQLCVSHHTIIGKIEIVEVKK